MLQWICGAGRTTGFDRDLASGARTGCHSHSVRGRESACFLSPPNPQKIRPQCRQGLCPLTPGDKKQRKKSLGVEFLHSAPVLGVISKPSHFLPGVRTNSKHEQPRITSRLLEVKSRSAFCLSFPSLPTMTNPVPTSGDEECIIFLFKCVCVFPSVFLQDPCANAIWHVACG